MSRVATILLIFTILLLSCVTKKNIASSENSIYNRIPNTYYFEQECKCFKEGISLGMASLKIVLNESSGQDEFSGKIYDGNADEPLDGVFIYYVVKEKEVYKKIEKIGESNSLGEFKILLDERFKSYDLAFHFVSYEGAIFSR